MMLRMTMLCRYSCIFILATALCGCVVAPVDGGNGTGDAGNGNGSTFGLVVFQDPDSAFETSDVHDVDDEIVQFDSATNAIIWQADGSSFQEGNWATDGNFLGAARNFQVRFGNVNGQRRAYFTETVAATICNIVITAGNLNIFATNTLVPQ